MAGPSGSGKSTLLNIIGGSGTDRPRAGSWWKAGTSAGFRARP